MTDRKRQREREARRTQSRTDERRRSGQYGDTRRTPARQSEQTGFQQPNQQAEQNQPTQQSPQAQQPLQTQPNQQPPQVQQPPQAQQPLQTQPNQQPPQAQQPPQVQQSQQPLLTQQPQQLPGQQIQQSPDQQVQQPFAQPTQQPVGQQILQPQLTQPNVAGLPETQQPIQSQQTQQVPQYQQPSQPPQSQQTQQVPQYQQPTQTPQNLQTQQVPQNQQPTQTQQPQTTPYQGPQPAFAAGIPAQSMMQGAIQQPGISSTQPQAEMPPQQQQQQFGNSPSVAARWEGPGGQLMGQSPELYPEAFADHLSEEARNCLDDCIDVSQVAAWSSDRALEEGPQAAQCSRLCHDAATLASVSAEFIAKDSITTPAVLDAYIEVAEQAVDELQKFDSAHTNEAMVVLERSIESSLDALQGF